MGTTCATIAQRAAARRVVPAGQRHARAYQQHAKLRRKGYTDYTTSVFHTARGSAAG
jgi:hypothetical protein